MILKKGWEDWPFIHELAIIKKQNTTQKSKANIYINAPTVFVQ